MIPGAGGAARRQRLRPERLERSAIAPEAAVVTAGTGPDRERSYRDRRLRRWRRRFDGAGGQQLYDARRLDRAIRESLWTPVEDIAFPVLHNIQQAPPIVSEEGPAPGPVPQPQPQSQPKNPPPRETVNLDTGTLVAATSLRNPLVVAALNAYLATKNLVVTQTAIREFLTGNIRAAGPSERVLAAALLTRVTVIPDNPSPRAVALQETKSISAEDKIIFGTGDQMRIRTVTSDLKFLRAARAQGVDFSVATHPSNPYSGQ